MIIYVLYMHDYSGVYNVSIIYIFLHVLLLRRSICKGSFRFVCWFSWLLYAYIYIYTHTSLYSSPLLSLAGYEFSLGCKLDHVKYQWHFCN